MLIFEIKLLQAFAELQVYERNRQKSHEVQFKLFDVFLKDLKDMKDVKEIHSIQTVSMLINPSTGYINKNM